MTEFEGPQVELVAFSGYPGLPVALAPDARALHAAGQFTGSRPARTIEIAGRTCYDSFGKGRNSKAYHHHILEVGHGSVLEHVSLTFFIHQVSRNLTHELVRHRVGTAVSQRSTRYVDESLGMIAWHPLIAQHCTDGEVDILSDVAVMARSAYSVIAHALEKALVAQGVDPLQARKQARGAARGVLPSALSTELTLTMNVRALRHVIELRCSDGADAEIRILAGRMLRLAAEIVPEYFSDYAESPAADGLGFVVTTPYRKV